MPDVKTSPLCSRNDGREIYFTARSTTAKLRVTFSREFLDDMCGDTASETDRKNWVTSKKPEIVASLQSADRRPPLDRVIIEEIN